MLSAEASTSFHAELPLCRDRAAADVGILVAERGCQRFDEAGRVNTIGSALLPLGAYLGVWAGASLSLLLAINVAINVVLLVLYAWLGHRELRGASASARWAPRYLREMASFGGWSMSTRLCGIVMLQVDRLAVVFLGSMTGLTYYAVPASVAARAVMAWTASSSKITACSGVVA